MILDPQQYDSSTTFDLVREAAHGHIGLDHRLIRVLLDRGEAILPDLIRFLDQEAATAPLDIGDFLVDVARALRTPAALPLLALETRRRDFTIEDELLAAFLELGPSSIDTLLELHAERSEAVDVTFTLAALRVRDPRILAILLAQLEKSPGEAVIELGLYGVSAAVPALEKALAAAGDDQKRRIDLENAIAECKSDRAFEPPPPFDVWTEYPEEEAPSFAILSPKELNEFLSSPVPAYRSQAIRALAFDPLTPTAQARIFDIAQNDPDVGVRAEAWKALEEFGEERDIGDALRRKVDDEAAPLAERAGALIALAPAASDDESLRRRILEFYDIPEVRAQAIEAMWRSTDRRFTDYAVRHLEDADTGIRRQAIAAAGWLGAVSQVGRLESFFDDEDVRESALFAYALAAPGEVTPARVNKLFDRIDDLAGGLTNDEAAIVMKALDNRLELRGYDPIFLVEEEDEEDEEEPRAPAASLKVGRNDPCPCGSGKKYKKCCGG